MNDFVYYICNEKNTTILTIYLHFNKNTIMASQTHSDWSSIQNQFYNATKDSYKKFNVLSTDHLSKLKNGMAVYPICTSLYNRYEPLHTAFTKTINEWQNANNFYQGATAKVDTVQDDLSKQIGIWDVKIMNVYYMDTPEYITLLPNGRAPFQTGGREQRIAAVETLATALANYPLLANVQQIVDAFAIDYKKKRDEQQQLEQSIPIKSKAVSDAHFAASDMMNRNLGLLIDAFGTDYIITSFFELDIVRNINQYNPDNISSNKVAEEGENYDVVV